MPPSRREASLGTTLKLLRCMRVEKAAPASLSPNWCELHICCEDQVFDGMLNALEANQLELGWSSH